MNRAKSEKYLPKVDHENISKDLMILKTELELIKEEHAKGNNNVPLRLSPDADKIKMLKGRIAYLKFLMDDARKESAAARYKKRRREVLENEIKNLETLSPDFMIGQKSVAQHIEARREKIARKYVVTEESNKTESL